MAKKDSFLNRVYDMLANIAGDSGSKNQDKDQDNFIASLQEFFNQLINPLNKKKPATEAPPPGIAIHNSEENEIADELHEEYSKLDDDRKALSEKYSNEDQPIFNQLQIDTPQMINNLTKAEHQVKLNQLTIDSLLSRIQEASGQAPPAMTPISANTAPENKNSTAPTPAPGAKALADYEKNLASFKNHVDSFDAKTQHGQSQKKYFSDDMERMKQDLDSHRSLHAGIARLQDELATTKDALQAAQNTASAQEARIQELSTLLAQHLQAKGINYINNPPAMSAANNTIKVNVNINAIPDPHTRDNKAQEANTPASQATMEAETPKPK
ncbi:hypothetical protein ACFORL_09485 [Legionella dresdenensis]|uniref:Uncharacterized protein n=1 Tax=Legionella dresdenensis TaxID=450200 RepID=A0ABV8CH21_9GAMM